MQQNAPFCVLLKNNFLGGGASPRHPTAFSLSRVGMYAMLGDKLHTKTALIHDAGRQTAHKNNVNTRCWETNCTQKQRKYTMLGDKLHTKTALIHDAGRQALKCSLCFLAYYYFLFSGKNTTIYRL